MKKLSFQRSLSFLFGPYLIYDRSHCIDENIKIYRKKEISDHKSVEKRIWVTYKDGVYDITDFIANHPGGADKIKLAAGGSVEPFWRIYQQHYNSKLPLELLSKMKIGIIHPDDMISEKDQVDEGDPYKEDPVISPVLICHQKKPINAEPPENLLTDSWITPVDLWFIRNHHPVPSINASTYSLSVTIPGQIKGGETVTKKYSLDEMKSKFKPHTVVASIQCGGNRRSEMNRDGSKPVTLGSPWGGSAISTAAWTGVRLLDLLEDAGLEFTYAMTLIDKLTSDTTNPNKNLHVQFTSFDDLQASVPLKKAVDKCGDVVLAYEMNGSPLPSEHGYPVRVIVPGHVGVRNVKWLRQVVVSDEEAEGPWQRGLAYKGFGPSITSAEGIDVEAIPSVQEMPVTSMITWPATDQTLSPGPQTLRGFAYSGGGKGIIRVDVSIDGGLTWKTAELTEGREQPLHRAWAWTFWECDVNIPAPKSGIDSVQLVCKAVDASYNVQPDSIAGVWNLRGINNNAWHRKVVSIKEETEDEES
jgi:sulfite oxidase